MLRGKRVHFSNALLPVRSRRKGPITLAVDSRELPKKGDVIAGKYQVEQVLGSGGMGVVFEATHRVTGKHFAIKWLLPQLTSGNDAVQRFIRESQVAGRINHRNVVEVYDVGQDGDSFYMVMELLQGEPLSRRITASSRLTSSEACEIMIPVARGLHAAHQAGIIHRDLKPDNIFLCRGEVGQEFPKVLDFGISKMSPLAADIASAAITREGVLMGTPHYMAPEQVRAQPVDPRTDVYALGVIMYQMLTGVLPFPGETFADLVIKIVSETPKPLRELVPDVSPELAENVARAMARDPAQRFATVAELARALEPFAEGAVFDIALNNSLRPLSARPPGPTTPLAIESDKVPSHVQGRDVRARVKPVHAAVGVGAVGGLALLAIVASSSQRSTHVPARIPPVSTLPTKPPAPQPTPLEPKPTLVPPSPPSTPEELPHVMVQPLPGNDVITPPPSEKKDDDALVAPSVTAAAKPASPQVESQAAETPRAPKLALTTPTNPPPSAVDPSSDAHGKKTRASSPSPLTPPGASKALSSESDGSGSGHKRAAAPKHVVPSDPPSLHMGDFFGSPSPAATTHRENSSR